MSKWQHPMKFTGIYPKSWAGYVFGQWSSKSSNWHEGVDYNLETGDYDLGTDVYAATDGVVEWIGYHQGWGNHLFINFKHPKHGDLYLHYAHLKDKSIKVKIGDKVTCGKYIAECGATGWNNMSPHLHFEIRKPIGEGYGFYPKTSAGWTLEKTKQFYFDPFLFIEAEIKAVEPVSEFSGEWYFPDEDIPASIEDHYKLKEREWYIKNWKPSELFNYVDGLVKVQSINDKKLEDIGVANEDLREYIKGQNVALKAYEEMTAPQAFKVFVNRLIKPKEAI